MNPPTVNRVVAVIAAIHVAAFSYFLAFVNYNGYLPQPFSYDSSDTFMDFFHTTYWAYQDGRYTEWLSIYPMFVFMVGQLISPAECYRIDAFMGRDCDHVSLYLVWMATFIAIYFNAKLFSSDKVTRILCFVAIVLSFPFLMAFERSNYILLAYVFVVFSVYARNRKWEGFFLACAINIKQYLLVLALPALLKRKYDVLFACFIGSIVLNVVSMFYLSEPYFLRLLTNMILFVDPDIIGLFTRLAYSMSVGAFISIAKAPRIESELYVLGLQGVAIFAQFLQFVVLAIVSFIIFRMSKLRRDLSEDEIRYAILVCLFNVTDTPGLYALILFLPILPTVYSKLSLRECVALLVLFLPFDASFLDTEGYESGYSYITGETVTHYYGFMLGSVYRPLAMFLLLAFMALRLARSKASEPTDMTINLVFLRRQPDAQGSQRALPGSTYTSCLV